MARLLTTSRLVTLTGTGGVGKTRLAIEVAWLAIKHELAEIAPGNFDAYYAVKDPVCDLVMAAAERWAQQTDWSPGPSGA